MTVPLPQHAQTLDHHRLAVLESTYPRWRIRRGANGMWCAASLVAPTPAQAEAGLHRYIIQPSMEALAAILCQQLEITQRIRG